jgi:hypothetical protein
MKNIRAYLTRVPERPRLDCAVMARAEGYNEWHPGEPPPPSERVTRKGTAIVDGALCGLWLHETGFELAQPLA